LKVTAPTSTDHYLSDLQRYRGSGPGSSDFSCTLYWENTGLRAKGFPKGTKHPLRMLLLSMCLFSISINQAHSYKPFTSIISKQRDFLTGN